MLCHVFVFDIFKYDLNIDKYINMFPEKRLFINIMFAYLRQFVNM